MGITSQAGIFGFGPQAGKGVLATTMYRHRATAVDLSFLDDQRIGDPEIGGVPVPGMAYKAGIVAAGNVVIQPRLKDTFGWLMYGAFGGYSGPSQCVATNKAFTSGQAVTSFPNPVVPNRKIKITLSAAAGSDVAFTVNGIDPTTVTDYNPDGATYASPETITVTAGQTTATGTRNYAKLTTVTANASVTASIGIDETGTTVMRAHRFHLPQRANYVPFMSFWKYIPGEQNDNSDDLGEIYKDGKIVSAAIALPNEGVITTALSVMARAALDNAGDKHLEDNAHSWVWANEYEDFETTPISSVIGGYIKLNGGGLNGKKLKVLNANVGIANSPLDIRQERIYGTPFIDDITVIGRSLTFDIVCRAEMDVYRTILSGASNGTKWTSRPFTASVEISSLAPLVLTQANGDPVKYGMFVRADKAMLSLTGGITLSGNDSVLMRLTGVALETADEYASVTLFNDKAAYNWPTP